MSTSTQILYCDPSSITFHSPDELPEITSAETLSSLKIASHRLLDHLQPVAFPTETVYGLGALALDSIAVSRIFSTKGRPADNPLIVHVSSFAMLHTLIPKGYTMPEAYQVLTRCFWPGPLTLLFPSDSNVIPPIVTANQPTVAIRMPSHPVARALIAILNSPLAAPSANSSGKPSPTRAEHVIRDLKGKVGIILDGGACDVGLESTVVDGLNMDGNIRVVRPGGVTVEDIERVLGEGVSNRANIPKVLVHGRDYRDEVIEQVPTTPGMKYRHYSPSVPVVLLLTSSIPPEGVKQITIASYITSLRTTAGDPSKLLKIGLLTPDDSLLGLATLLTEGLQWHRYPLGPTLEPSVSAHRLFDGILTLEKQGVDLILIEEIKEEKEGLAVMNRVKKAAAECRWVTFS